MVSIKCLLKHQSNFDTISAPKKDIRKLMSEINYLIMFNFISNGNNSRVVISFWF